VEVKKEKAVTATEVPHSRPIITEDVLIKVDDGLKVYYRGLSDYKAEALEVSFQDRKSIFRVHYKDTSRRKSPDQPRQSLRLR
jgi:hypothetical protein